MLAQSTLEYYRHREETERQLAANAPNEVVEKVHRELADSYARIIAIRSTETAQLPS